MKALTEAADLAQSLATPERPGVAYMYASARSIKPYESGGHDWHYPTAYLISADPSIPLEVVRKVVMHYRRSTY